MVRCPKPRCQTPMIKGEHTTMVVCPSPSCKYSFCARCKVEWHADTTCEKYQQWLKENGSAADLFEAWKKQNTKPCPKESGGCGRDIQKVGPHVCQHPARRRTFHARSHVGCCLCVFVPVFDAPPPPSRVAAATTCTAHAAGLTFAGCACKSTNRATFLAAAARLVPANSSREQPAGRQPLLSNNDAIVQGMVHQHTNKAHK